eukprot:m.531412 g.531412  ORF g.531412 m.531412 type:complete len:440 (-) comp22034_c0_seq1:649-1968(-)
MASVVRIYFAKRGPRGAGVCAAHNAPCQNMACNRSTTAQSSSVAHVVHVSRPLGAITLLQCTQRGFMATRGHLRKRGVSAIPSTSNSLPGVVRVRLLRWRWARPGVEPGTVALTEAATRSSSRASAVLVPVADIPSHAYGDSRRSSSPLSSSSLLSASQPNSTAGSVRGRNGRIRGGASGAALARLSESPAANCLGTGEGVVASDTASMISVSSMAPAPAPVGGTSATVGTAGAVAVGEGCTATPASPTTATGLVAGRAAGGAVRAPAFFVLRDDVGVPLPAGVRGGTRDNAGVGARPMGRASGRWMSDVPGGNSPAASPCTTALLLCATAAGAASATVPDNSRAISSCSDSLSTARLLLPAGVLSARFLTGPLLRAPAEAPAPGLPAGAAAPIAARLPPCSAAVPLGFFPDARGDRAFVGIGAADDALPGRARGMLPP